jgi:hypothetical protein
MLIHVIKIWYLWPFSRHANQCKHLPTYETSRPTYRYNSSLSIRLFYIAPASKLKQQTTDDYGAVYSITKPREANLPKPLHPGRKTTASSRECPRQFPHDETTSATKHGSDLLPFQPQNVRRAESEVATLNGFPICLMMAVRTVAAEETRRTLSPYLTYSSISWHSCTICLFLLI